MKILKIVGKVLLIILCLLVLLLIAAFLFLTFYDGVGALPNKEMRNEYSEKADYFNGKAFHNINDTSTITGDSGKRSERTKPNGKIPVIKLDEIDKNAKGELKVTWLGHSSSLVQLGEKNILIDPILTKYASPVGFTGVKRFSEVPIQLKDIPEIDVLLISHDHYDHLDYRTIPEIDDKVKNYIVPLGVESYLLDWDIDESKIHTVAWWDELTIDDINFTATPSQHFSGRNPLKPNSTLWCGFLFDDNYHSVYYSGDTGYSNSFKEIGERFGDVDLALVECGQYDNAWANIHMNPKETIQAADDIKAKWMIPIHWGAFVLANHDWDEPPRLATEYGNNANVNVSTPKIGETIDFNEIENYTEHWWEAVE